MTKEAIFERISFIIKEQMNKPDLEITQTTSLHDDLGVDSIALTEFVINLEDEFHLEIPDEDVEMVANTANVSEEEARAALEECKGDLAEAIMKLNQ